MKCHASVVMIVPLPNPRDFSGLHDIHTYNDEIQTEYMCTFFVSECAATCKISFRSTQTIYCPVIGHRIRGE